MLLHDEIASACLRLLRSLMRREGALDPLARSSKAEDAHKGIGGLLVSRGDCAPFIQPRCLIASFDGAVFSQKWKKAL